MSQSLESNENNYIKIFLRLKSNVSNEKETEANNIKVSNDNKSIYLFLSHENKSSFIFDQIFDEKEPQKNIFEIIGKPLCFSFLEGFNSSVILYGKKNSGKTYTLLGKSIGEIQRELEGDKNNKDNIYSKYLDNKGLLILCIDNIFNNLMVNNFYENFSFNISVSFIEIFDNNILDFFNKDNFDNNSKFNYDEIFKKKYFSDLNFTKLNISSIDEALFILNQGLEIRNSLFNEINMTGINGHSIITLYMEKINKETNQAFKSSFNFVEISSTSNIIKNKYNISINQSLETFSYIVNQLSDNVRRENILFTNSILTNILKESIGGNSKTSIIVNISPYNNILDSFQTIYFSSKFAKIINNPNINEIISDDVDYAYYNELLTKNENLKNEKNYLLNYLANLNRNVIEKIKENAAKKSNNQNNNQKKKEKDENLKKTSKEISIINSHIQQIDNDIKYKQKEKDIFFDKYNKIHISLFKQNNDIEQKKKGINNIKIEKDNTRKLILNYQKNNINLDSQILQSDLLIKENQLKNNEDINTLNKEISFSKMQSDEKESILKNFKEKYNSLFEENKAKINIKNELEKIKETLMEEKEEKTKKIEENKNKYEQAINKSENIEQEIINKNSQLNNFQKNLEQYDEYENNTINNFIKLYDNNSKKETQNNNKLYDFQKCLPDKEKELQEICDNIDKINNNKIKIMEEQDKIKREINNYENRCKTIENQNKIYNQQVNNLQEKITILTLNLNNLNNNDSPMTLDKNNDINSSVLSFDLYNSNNNAENDLFVFKNNFNLELNDEQKKQLFENKKKLLEIEQKENVSLKEKKKIINNEIYKFKINQSKNSSYNNKEKSHNQYNLVGVEENMNKINEKEIIIKNYQKSLNSNYHLLDNYLNQNESNNNNNTNSNSIENDISMGQFKNLFNKFIERANKIDEEFELVKKEFKESGAEYKLASKEAINTSLRNNPLLKNYEEIYKINDENNNSIIQYKNENKSKRITLNNNKILNDSKNLQIYNRIYPIIPQKRSLNDYLKMAPEYKRSFKKESGIRKYLDLDIKTGNESQNNRQNKKDLNIIDSSSDKENKNNIISKTTNTKAQFNNTKEKNKNNNELFFKSPDKKVNKEKNINIIGKSNVSKNNDKYINNFKSTTNKNNEEKKEKVNNDKEMKLKKE